MRKKYIAQILKSQNIEPEETEVLNILQTIFYDHVMFLKYIHKRYILDVIEILCLDRGRLFDFNNEPWEI